ncbi:MAG: hypothetical protein M5U09_11015 [Gammaproteobacteria bacterium]|nr:hypothetical protein [Gammaproteobacteria bacterium]
MAPVSLSTSYFTGSPLSGISMITLMSSGTDRPEGTLSRIIRRSPSIGVCGVVLVPPAGRRGPLPRGLTGRRDTGKMV